MNNVHVGTPETARGPGADLGSRHLWGAVLLMLACLVLSIWLKPTHFWAEKVGEPQFEAVVPKSFGDWVENPYGAQAVVNPQLQEAIRETYTSTLARTYIHKPTGRQVMLSLAYGRDQSRDTQMHPPEACYAGGGFRIDRLAPVDIQAGSHTIPAFRMDAVMGARHEFVTYWMRVGDRVARGSLDRNLVRMTFAFRGYIADGLLVRVSEITRAKPEDTYALQDEFLRAMLAEATKVGAIDEFVGKKAP